MKQKVLITGASGFVGFHLIENALEKGLDVHAAIRKSSDVNHLEGYPIKFVYPDFSRVESLEEMLKENQYEFIIHAAGSTKAKDQQEYNKVNASYTVNLLKAAANVGSTIKKVVFLSSLAAVGPLNKNGELIDESTTNKPVTAYGKSKLLAEEQVKGLNVPLIVLRPTAVYGPRDKDLFIIFKTFNSGLEPYIGTIKQQLSFIYVKDLAEITVKALFVENHSNGTYNLTDGNCYERYELANTAKKFLNKKTFKFHLPVSIVRLIATAMEKVYGFTGKTPALNVEKLNELTAVNWCCNILKAKRDLQFTPRFPLEAGVKETVEWYKRNNWF